MLPVFITIGSLLVVSYLMQSDRTGMMNLIATDVAAVVGPFYPAAAVLIGSSGAFVTGTGLGSNIMFADMHMQAAASLGINPITVFAGQNAGASLGNLICPNNTVAACATVGEEEGHAEDAGGVRHHSCALHDAHHAVHLCAFPAFRRITPVRNRENLL